MCSISSNLRKSHSFMIWIPRGAVRLRKAHVKERENLQVSDFIFFDRWYCNWYVKKDWKSISSTLTFFGGARMSSEWRGAEFLKIFLCFNSSRGKKLEHSNNRLTLFFTVCKLLCCWFKSSMEWSLYHHSRMLVVLGREKMHEILLEFQKFHS